MSTASGYVRTWPAHLFSETMRAGMTVLKADDGGPPAAAGWIPTEGDIFIATRQGLAVRFPAKTVPAQGAQGIRLDTAGGDAVAAVTGVKDESGVFLLGADGRGTIRLMSGFNANRAPGAGGKIALKTDALVSAAAVSLEADIFIITRLCKIIRFKAREVPAKEGVVQGVNCISLRGDEPVAVVTTDDGR
jgi:DNA gyrase subunit A